MEETKTCNICFITKNRSEFNRDKTSIRNDCKQCRSNQLKERQKLIKEGKHIPKKRNKVETITIKVNDEEQEIIKFKKCNKCNIIKNVEHYSTDYRLKQKVIGQCKSCQTYENWFPQYIKV